jgi:hypothetical protein
VPQIRGGGGESAGRRRIAFASCHSAVEVEDDEGLGRRRPASSSSSSSCIKNEVARLAGPTCQMRWLTPSTIRAHPVSRDDSRGGGRPGSYLSFGGAQTSAPFVATSLSF